MKKLIYLMSIMLFFSASQDCDSEFDLAIPSELMGKTFKIPGSNLNSVRRGATNERNSYLGVVTVVFEDNNILITGDAAFKASVYDAKVPGPEGQALEKMHVEFIDSVADVQELVKGNKEFSAWTQKFTVGSSDKDKIILADATQKIWAISLLNVDTEVTDATHQKVPGSVSLHLYFDYSNSERLEMVVPFYQLDAIVGEQAYETHDFNKLSGALGPIFTSSFIYYQYTP